MCAYKREKERQRERERGEYSQWNMLELLIAISTRGSFSSHFSKGELSSNVRSTCSTERFILSTNPFELGWYAVVYLCTIPSCLHNSFQNLATSLGSRSEWIDLGTPCRRTTCCTIIVVIVDTSVIVEQDNSIHEC